MRKLTLAYDYIFPSYVLPNATMPETGVINYLTSMHRTDHSQIFDNFPISDIFNKSLGYQPNAGSGHFFPSNVYRNIVDFEEVSIYSIHNLPNKKFLYVIKPNPNLIDFIGVDTITKRLNGEYFWKYISEEARRLIQQKTGYILIDYSMEPYITYDFHLKLHKSLKNSGLEKDSIYICVNSFNARECYESWFTEDGRKYNIRNLPFCIDYSSWFYSNALEHGEGKLMTTDVFNNTRNIIRKNHFLMKIRNSREHRNTILYMMINDDILGQGDWSYLSKNNFNLAEVNHHVHLFKLDNISIPKIMDAYEKFPHHLQNEQNITYDDVNAWTDLDYQSYINSYFEICFETLVDGEHLSLTEKVFKPIINFQPFIFVAYPGALKHLQKLGFKTFDGFVDESYDNISGTAERLHMIYKEIKRLSMMPIEELHNWYWRMEDVLIHNHTLLLNYHKNKLFGEEFINELYKITE